MPRGPRVETPGESIRRQAAMAATMLQAHLNRCSICARGSGIYDGRCLRAVQLQRELAAARRLLERFRTPPAPA